MANLPYGVHVASKTFMVSAADYDVLRASGQIAPPGTTMIDPVTNLLVGVVQGDGTVLVSLSSAQVAATQALVSGAGIPWASRVAPATAGVGALQWFSDVGGGSLWRSDGTNWRPLNGRVNLYSTMSALASPFATLNGNGTAQSFVMPTSQVIPVGMIWPGARITCAVRIRRTALAGAPVTSTGSGARLCTAESSAGYIAGLVVAQSSLSATVGQTLEGDGYIDALNVSTFIGTSFMTGRINNQPSGNYLTFTADNSTIPLYLVPGIGSDLIAGDVLGIMGFRVWLEG